MNCFRKMSGWITGLFTQPAPQADGGKDRAFFASTSTQRENTMIKVVLESGYVATLERPADRVEKPIPAASLGNVAAEFIEFDETITQVVNEPQPTDPAAA